jgi:hypothetical protein
VGVRQVFTTQASVVSLADKRKQRLFLILFIQFLWRRVMSKTNFADPHDDFDEEFIEWVAELLREYNDDEFDSDHTYNDNDNMAWLSDLKRGDFYD